MGTDPPLPKDVWDRTPPEARELISALFARIAQLEARVKALEEENRRLRERVNRNSTNSSQPPSSDPPSVKRRPPGRPTGRKRGGQPGHRRHERVLVPPDQVSETFEIKPEACRRCGHGLKGEDLEPLRHQVAELPPVQPIVREYRLHRLRCPQCGTTTCAQLPRGVPPGWFGPRLQAVLSLLAGAYRLSKRAIQALAADLFGLSISIGMICKMEQSTAAALQRPYDELEEYVRGEHAGIDETSWREGGRKAWLWVVGAALVTIFRIACSRGAEVARRLLGADYAHVATCDRWKSYLWIGRCQLCWSHLRRDFQAMIDRENSGSKVGKTLLTLSDQLFHLWHRVRAGTLARCTFQKRLGPLRRQVREQLERGARCRCAKTAATCRDLLKQEKKLWTFVWVAGIEPTNNQQERSLRHAVLWRKTSGGTDSPAGSRFVERMLSVVATCRQQRRHVLEFLTQCCAAHVHGVRPPTLLPQLPTARKVA